MNRSIPTRLPLSAFLRMVSVCTALSCGAQGYAWQQWSGNGHYYQAVNNGGNLSWSQAYSAAQSMTGPNGTPAYLVSITSQAENDFVFSLVNNSQFWNLGYYSYGPWIGFYQPPGSPEPAGNWQWTTGEPTAFLAWDVNQPDGDGNHAHFLSTGSGAPGPKWNDQPNGPACRAYVVETAAHRVNGSAYLYGYQTSVVGELLEVEVWQSDSLGETLDGNYGPNGTFAFSPTVSGAAVLKFRFRTSLWKAVPVTLGPTPIENLTVTMTNGDCNHDNAVDIGDFALLSSVYGLFVGDPGYDTNADLNGDTTVDIGDYAILSGSYGEFGD